MAKEHSLPVNDIYNYLESNSIPHDTYKLNMAIDLSGCFDEDDDGGGLSEEANHLLDFITGVRGFTRSSSVLNNTIKVATLKKMRSMVESCSIGGKDTAIIPDLAICAHR